MAAEAARERLGGLRAHGGRSARKTVPQGVRRHVRRSTSTASAEDNAEAMVEAIAGVRDGEVTHAVRDSQAADGTPDP